MGETSTAGKGGSGVVCAGAVATGAEMDGAGTMGAAAGVCATGGAGCFRAKKKKKIAANRIMAAEEMRIGVVDFDRVGCFGRDGDETLTADAEGSAAIVTACSRGSGVSGVVARTFSGGTMSVGTFLCRMRVRVSLRRFGFCGTGVGAAGVGETGSGETGLGGTGLGRTGLAAAEFGGA